MCDYGLTNSLTFYFFFCTISTQQTAKNINRQLICVEHEEVGLENDIENEAIWWTVHDQRQGKVIKDISKKRGKL